MGQLRGQGRPRVPITDEQLRELQALYGDVPTQTRVHHEWDSNEGRRFLRYVMQLVGSSVPLRWIAHVLGLDDRILQQAISRPTNHGTTK